MAVTKLWPVTKRLAAVIDYAKDIEKTVKANSKYSEADYQALRDVINYAKDGKKTEMEYFCQGINCDPATAREEFVMTKSAYGKTDGIQAYHGYLSFKEQDITPETAQAIGMEFAKRVWGDRFQVVVTTHLNTEHLHCHFVVNSVSFSDGKRLHGEEKAWFKFRLIADEICRSYGLHVIEEPERNADAYYLQKKDQRGEPTKYNILRSVIDKAISESRNMKEFEYRLKSMGYQFNFNYGHKYWTITPPKGKKPVRLYRLGEEYGHYRIEERIRENQDKVIQQPYYKAQPQAYLLYMPQDLLLNHSRLYRKYLYYCYRLGVLPKRTEKPTPLSAEALEAIRYLDKITMSVDLMANENIETDEDLADYKATVESKVSELSQKRAALRNEIRRVGISEPRISEAKQEISELSAEITRLNKDIKTCNFIAERSKDIDEHIKAMDERDHPKKERGYIR